MCNRPSPSCRWKMAEFCWLIQCFSIRQEVAASSETHSLVLSGRWFYINHQAVEFSSPSSGDDNWKLVVCLDSSYGYWGFLLVFLGTRRDCCKGCFLNYYHFCSGEMNALYCNRRAPRVASCLRIWKMDFARVACCCWERFRTAGRGSCHCFGSARASRKPAWDRSCRSKCSRSRSWTCWGGRFSDEKPSRTDRHRRRLYQLPRLRIWLLVYVRHHLEINSHWKKGNKQKKFRNRLQIVVGDEAVDECREKLLGEFGSISLGLSEAAAGL